MTNEVNVSPLSQLNKIVKQIVINRVFAHVSLKSVKSLREQKAKKNASRIEFLILIF